MKYEKGMKPKTERGNGNFNIRLPKQVKNWNQWGKWVTRQVLSLKTCLMREIWKGNETKNWMGNGNFNIGVPVVVVQVNHFGQWTLVEFQYGWFCIYKKLYFSCVRQEILECLQLQRQKFDIARGRQKAREMQDLLLIAVYCHMPPSRGEWFYNVNLI